MFQTTNRLLYDNDQPFHEHKYETLQAKTNPAVGWLRYLILIPHKNIPSLNPQFCVNVCFRYKLAIIC